MRIAKADLVPTDANLLAAYRTFGELEAACRRFRDDLNDREHRETRRRPVEALAEERARLHPLPRESFTVAFGTTRRVKLGRHDLGWSAAGCSSAIWWRLVRQRRQRSGWPFRWVVVLGGVIIVLGAISALITENTSRASNGGR